MSAAGCEKGCETSKSSETSGFFDAIQYSSDSIKRMMAALFSLRVKFEEFEMDEIDSRRVKNFANVRDSLMLHAYTQSSYIFMLSRDFGRKGQA